jgi:hypothetical protein
MNQIYTDLINAMRNDINVDLLTTIKNVLIKPHSIDFKKLSSGIIDKINNHRQSQERSKSE